MFIRIEDPDEAQDHFIVARSNCKGFAFVHIAHAQFEVAQGTEALCVYQIDFVYIDSANLVREITALLGTESLSNMVRFIIFFLCFLLR